MLNLTFSKWTYSSIVLPHMNYAYIVCGRCHVWRFIGGGGGTIFGYSTSIKHITIMTWLQWGGGGKFTCVRKGTAKKLSDKPNIFIIIIIIIIIISYAYSSSDIAHPTRTLQAYLFCFFVVLFMSFYNKLIYTWYTCANSDVNTLFHHVVTYLTMAFQAYL